MRALLASLTTLLSSLDPTSIKEHLAFYHLYPNTTEGKEALHRAWELLSPGTAPLRESLHLPILDVSPFIALTTSSPYPSNPQLTVEQLDLIETLGSSLHNRTLKGFRAPTLAAIDALESDQIDLARALFLHDLDPATLRQYEAALDLMALEIRARLTPTSTPLDTVNAINHLIFYDRKFRFPPHSEHVKDIDLYTFLPAVMDSRRGVCLGVSILYICLAQRLGLPLTIYTPPGHIFVACEERNIETTARGIHVPLSHYLSVQTKALHPRTVRETIGFSFFNHAATAWQKGHHKVAIEFYEKALHYIPQDPLSTLFLAYNLLFEGDVKRGEALLKTVRDVRLDGCIDHERGPADYLDGKCDIEALRAVYSHVNETRRSIEEKRDQLKAITHKFPRFRDAFYHLAICYLQLHRGREAKEVLLKYHALDPTNPTVEYYLSILSMERLAYKDAEHFLNNALALTAAAGHHPRALRELTGELKRLYPIQM